MEWKSSAYDRRNYLPLETLILWDRLQLVGKSGSRPGAILWVLWYLQEA